jgi:hypothetical protein
MLTGNLCDCLDLFASQPEPLCSPGSVASPAGEASCFRQRQFVFRNMTSECLAFTTQPCVIQRIGSLKDSDPEVMRCFPT